MILWLSASSTLCLEDNSILKKKKKKGIIIIIEPTEVTTCCKFIARDQTSIETSYGKIFYLINDTFSRLYAIRHYRQTNSRRKRKILLQKKEKTKQKLG